MPLEKLLVTEKVVVVIIPLGNFGNSICLNSSTDKGGSRAGIAAAVVFRVAVADAREN